MARSCLTMYFTLHGLLHIICIGPNDISGKVDWGPGRKPKLITHQKTQHKNLILNNNCNPCPDHLTSFSVAGTADHDQPVLCHSSLTTLSTASHTHTMPTTPMPGLVTGVGYQQHTAGHSDVPHTAGHTAHHSVGGRDWDTGSGGSDVTTPTGLSFHLSNHLSSDARSVGTTSEEGGLMLLRCTKFIN